MNFNSDYQSNQNRIRTNELVNVGLDDEKTKTKFNYQKKVRVLGEILFVLTAVGLGYMQGLKSYTSTKNPTKTQAIQDLKKSTPENHLDWVQKK